MPSSSTILSYFSGLLKYWFSIRVTPFLWNVNFDIVFVQIFEKGGLATVGLKVHFVITTYQNVNTWLTECLRSEKKCLPFSLALHFLPKMFCLRIEMHSPIKDWKHFDCFYLRAGACNTFPIHFFPIQQPSIRLSALNLSQNIYKTSFPNGFPNIDKILTMLV